MLTNGIHKYDFKKWQAVFHSYMNEEKTCAAIGIWPIFKPRHFRPELQRKSHL